MTILKQSRQYTREMTYNRYHRQADRVKMLRKTYNDDIHSSYIMGVMDMCCHIFEKHKSSKYDSVDELIGEMHIVYGELYDYYLDNLLINAKIRYRASKLELEDIVGMSERV